MTTADILALPVQSNARLLQSSDDLCWYALDAGQAGSSATRITGSSLITTINTGTNFEVYSPGEPLLTGNEVTFHVISTGGGNLTLAAGILVPSASSFSGTYAMTPGKLTVVKLQRCETAWMLVSLVGEYTI